MYLLYEEIKDSKFTGTQVSAIFAEADPSVSKTFMELHVIKNFSEKLLYAVSWPLHPNRQQTLTDSLREPLHYVNDDAAGQLFQYKKALEEPQHPAHIELTSLVNLKIE